MVKFHGDLLMGGVALRNIKGTMAVERWVGRFSVEKERTDLLEIGRTYLLLLDDGRSSRVVVTGVQQDQQPQHRVVQFTAG